MAQRLGVGVRSMVATLLLVVLGAMGAVAQGSTELAWPVTDEVGAVQGATGDIERATQELRDRTDTQLFVLYTDTTDGIPVTDHAQAIAEANGLGVGDGLYLIATGDRTHALWLGDGVIEKVSVDRQDDILLEAEDRLADGDLAGAPVVVAEQLQATLADGGLSLGPILAVLALGAVGVGLWVAWSRRRGTAGGVAADAAGTPAEPPTVSNAQLLELDEQVRNATNELGFVEAMYGPEEVQPYAEAIDKARAELTAAFGVRQRLDDAEPEDAATQRTMLEELAGHVSSAQSLLSGQRDHLRQLRDVEQDAPRLIPTLEADVAALEQRLPEADRQRATLESSYAPANWASVRGNRTEAAKRVAAARDSLAEASTALTGDDRSRAAVELLGATQAVTEATALLDALGTAVDRAGHGAVAAPRRGEPVRPPTSRPRLPRSPRAARRTEQRASPRRAPRSSGRSSSRPPPRPTSSGPSSRPMPPRPSPTSCRPARARSTRSVSARRACSRAPSPPPRPGWPWPPTS